MPVVNYSTEVLPNVYNSLRAGSAAAGAVLSGDSNVSRQGKVKRTIAALVLCAALTAPAHAGMIRGQMLPNNNKGGDIVNHFIWAWDSFWPEWNIPYLAHGLGW